MVNRRRIRAEMAYHRMSQEDLVEVMNTEIPKNIEGYSISLQTLSAKLNKRGYFKAFEISFLADFFGISADTLLSWRKGDTN